MPDYGHDLRLGTFISVERPAWRAIRDSVEHDLRGLA